jgi:pimeloyl-ACP methyl ester carboxylesterase
MRLPGFGRPMDEYARATREQWQTAIRDELADLRKDHASVWLVGHSMGGALATQEALEHPDAIAGLILLAPLFEVNAKRSPLLKPRSWFALTDRLCVFTDMTEMAFDVDLHDASLRDAVVRDRFVPRSLYGELFALTDSIAGRAAELRVPVLLAYAPDDLVTDPGAAQRYLAAATNAPLRVCMAQTRAGHVVTWDFGWEQLVERIAEIAGSR